jgi:hypothetical protein
MREWVGQTKYIKFWLAMVEGMSSSSRVNGNFYSADALPL